MARTLHYSLHLQLLFTCLGVALNSEAHSFMLGAYVPYWKVESGIHTIKKYCDLFDQISPFSFEINKNGSVLDKFRRTYPYWHDIHSHCKKKGVLFVPTIYWTDTEQMHDVLSNPKKREFHIQSIMDTVIKNTFDGININYERVCSHDRKGYIAFMRTLSKRLHAKNLVLYTSIGCRTGDRTIAYVYPGTPPAPPLKTASHKTLQDHANKKPKKSHISLNPGTGAEATEYKRMLAECCDQVNIMGYDEWGKPYLHGKEHLANKYYLSHSSNQWIEQSIQYALSFIPAHKVVLGIPSYGLEFCISEKNGHISMKKKRAVLFPTAHDTAKRHRKKPKRTAGGELSYIYHTYGDKRYVCYLDANCIKEKIAIAKKYGIKGLYIFTITGNEDPAMWSMLEKELRYSKVR